MIAAREVQAYEAVGLRRELNDAAAAVERARDLARRLGGACPPEVELNLNLARGHARLALLAAADLLREAEETLRG